MWQRLGSFVIKNRLILLIGLFAVTAVMGYFASKVKLSYEFAKAIQPIIPNTKTTWPLEKNLATMVTYW